MNFVILSQTKGEILKKLNFKFEKKALLLWGGGKDSIVSYGLIKDKIDFTPFIFGKIDKIKENSLNIVGKKALLVKRKLSENLFKLNKLGYYNGHVPITGIIAFCTPIVSYLYNYSYTVLSNEKSSSEENTTYMGLKINHQYSKGYEFEKDFSKYLNKYISQDIKYFSLLRGMYEYKIAEFFSKQKEFFKVFSSCNRNFVINPTPKPYLVGAGGGVWCCNCEKCSFVFLILSNFLKIEELVSIFGENLLENKKLLNTFEGLIGFLENKPFECVGTYEESFLSFYNLVLFYDDKNNIPYIINELKNKVLKESEKINLKKLEEKLLKIYDDDIIPVEIKKHYY